MRAMPDDAASDEPSPSEPPDGAVMNEPDVVNAPPVTEIDAAAVEALLFSTRSPLTAGRIAELLGLDSTGPVRKTIATLNTIYEDTGRSFRIEQVAGGFSMLTLPRFGELLKTLHQKEADAKLGKSAIETLAIIAYKQPVLRVDVEAIRGVACGETIRGLMEKHLVKITGRAELPGRPILYGTTKRFLEVFGLNTLKDLPQPQATPPRA
jgi:segregation and condensation protein B